MLNKIIALITLSCVIGVALCSETNDDSCVFIVEEPTGEHYSYDVSKLGDLSVSADDKTFKLNLCHTVASGCAKGTAICLTNSNTSLGTISSLDVVPYAYDPPAPGTGFIIMFDDGDKCGYEDYYSSAVIVRCSADKTAEVNVKGVNGCYGEFMITSKYACGAPLSSSSASSNPSSSTITTVTESTVVFMILLTFISLL